MAAGAFLVRLFDPTRLGTTALTFRHFGPLLRFDHHRPPRTAPADDPERGIYYAAPTLSSCLVEVFGDTGLVTPGTWHVARPCLRRDLILLDLRGPGAMRAGTVAALAKVPDRAISQSWSRHFHAAPEYGGCDGLIFYNAHNDEEAIALYECAEAALDCPPPSIMLLDHPALRPILLRIAADHNLVVTD